MAAHDYMIGHSRSDTAAERPYCMGMRFKLRWFILPLLIGALIGQSVRAQEDDAVELRWPKNSTLRVYTALGSGYSSSLRLAISNWNSLRSPVRIEVAKSREKANVLLRVRNSHIMQKMCETSCAGQASQFGPGDGISHITLWDDMPGGLINRGALVMHELGHILGLGHVDRECALMHSNFQFACGGAMFSIHDIKLIKAAYPEWTPPETLQLRPLP